MLLKRPSSLDNILPSINVSLVSFNYSGPEAFGRASLIKTHIDNIVLEGKWKNNDNINHLKKY